MINLYTLSLLGCLSRTIIPTTVNRWSQISLHVSSVFYINRLFCKSRYQTVPPLSTMRATASIIRLFTKLWWSGYFQIPKAISCQVPNGTSFPLHSLSRTYIPFVVNLVIHSKSVYFEPPSKSHLLSVPTL